LGSNWLATGWHKCLGPRTGWQLAGTNAWALELAGNWLAQMLGPSSWLATGWQLAGAHGNQAAAHCSNTNWLAGWQLAVLAKCWLLGN